MRRLIFALLCVLLTDLPVQNCPSAFQQYITWTEHYCRVYNFDSNWALACFAGESNFNPAAESEKGAIGIVQMLVSTAQIYDPCITREQLFDPETNIRLGVHFLSDLDRRFKGDKNKVLQHYFWGNKQQRHQYYYWRIKRIYNKILKET